MDHQEIKTFEKLSTQGLSEDLKGESVSEIWALVEQEELTVDTQKAWDKISPEITSRSTSMIPALLKVAAVLLLIGTFTYIGITRFTAVSPDFSYASQVERKEIYLPDGSEVTLAKDANINFRSTDQKRAIELNGKAFFDVVESTLPFEITTRSGMITVLGTSFEVKDDRRGLEVAVSTGKVKVMIERSEKLLKANQILVFDSEQKTIKIIEAQAGNLDAWKNGYYSFQNEKFGNVIELLERNHDIEVIMDDLNLKNCSITGKFDLRDTESLLSSFSKALGFRYKLKNQQLIITGKGC